MPWRALKAGGGEVVFTAVGNGAGGAENEKPRQRLARLRGNVFSELRSRDDSVPGKAARALEAGQPGAADFADRTRLEHAGCVLGGTAGDEKENLRRPPGRDRRAATKWAEGARVRGPRC